MNPNVLQWDGAPGHYEAHYLSATDPGSGLGLWIRYTMRAPLRGPAECALWFMAMDRDGLRVARKATHPIAELRAQADPFRLTLAGADLSDRGMAGDVAGAAWELSWEPTLPAAEHVSPLLRRAGVASTVLVLVHPDVAVSGTVRVDGREIVLEGARGGQAHLWGSKHAVRWAWTHANDLRGLDGGPRPGAYVDAVSVFLARLGRELGPSTPVVGRFGGEDFRATGPIALARTTSRFGLSTWRFEARDGRRRVVGEIDAPRQSLVGVTYLDPDGDAAYCYNSEVASMRLFVWDRTSRGRFGWTLRDTLVADATAHFEYAQRAPVPGLALLVV
ncbi:MAG: hypothetical protein QOC78_2443 [Solirubrobacteraceae bacterium]|jgi:hypothetical protein|nr:hypothetical protein [Solirubrobacteraceae bacterium]